MAHDALESLCRIYWPPIYSFLRRQGHDRAAAEDLTQGFFLKILERDGIAKARADRGRFRTFLLVSLKNFLADERDRAAALKRSPERRAIALDSARAERWLAAEAAGAESPEEVFDRGWAEALIARALDRLEEDMAGSMDPDRFIALRPFLAGGRTGGYADVALTLGIGEPAVRVGVHRMRRRFGDLLRDEVAETVGPGSDVEDELRYLRKVLSR